MPIWGWGMREQGHSIRGLWLREVYSLTLACQLRGFILEVHATVLSRLRLFMVYAAPSIL